MEASASGLRSTSISQAVRDTGTLCDGKSIGNVDFYKAYSA